MYLYDNDSYLISSFRKQPYYYPQNLYKTEQYVNVAHLKSNRLKAIGAGETAARFAGVRVEKTQQLIMGIVFLVMVAVFADRETGMIVK